MHYNLVGWKYFVGPMKGVLILLFEYIVEVFENYGELLGFDHMGCQ